MKIQAKTPQTPHMHYVESHMQNPTADIASNTLQALL